MLRILSQFFGSGAGRSRPAHSTGVQRFSPRLEVLDGRAMPSVSVVGVIDGFGGLAGGVLPSGVTSVIDGSGGLSGGVIASDKSGIESPSSIIPLHIGEEIPQVLS